MNVDIHYCGLNRTYPVKATLKQAAFLEMRKPHEIAEAIDRDGFYYSDHDVRGVWVRCVVVPHGRPVRGGAALALNIRQVAYV